MRMIIRTTVASHHSSQQTWAVAALCLSLLLPGWRLQAQTLKEYADSVVVNDDQVRIVLHTANGAIDYHFAGGTDIYNAVGYVLDTRTGLLLTTSLAQHPYSTEAVHDSLGDGLRINIRHMDDHHAPGLGERDHPLCQPPLGTHRFITRRQGQPVKTTVGDNGDFGTGNRPGSR